MKKSPKSHNNFTWKFFPFYTVSVISGVRYKTHNILKNSCAWIDKLGLVASPEGEEKDLAVCVFLLFLCVVCFLGGFVCQEETSTNCAFVGLIVFLA